MSTQFQDSSGNILTPPPGSTSPDQQVANSSGLVINPATQETLSSIDSKTPASGAITDAQLRATPVPVSGTVTATTGGLTDAQLRASAVPVSSASLPLPSGASTEITLAALNAKLGTLGQKSMAGSAPIVIASDQGPVPQNLVQIGGVASGVANPLPVRLGDGVGFVDIKVAAGSGDRYLGAAIIQDEHNLPGNSSTANLAAGASFTGATESNEGGDVIDVSLIADQDCLLSLQQSINGTTWGFTDNYLALAGIGFATSVKATGLYFRVVVTNQGAVSTTDLRLDSHKMPVSSVLPRALSQRGNLKVAVEENDVQAATYSASVDSVASPTTPTDIFTIYGVANKVIRIRRLVITATQSTASIMSILLLRRSAANVGGTSTLLVNVANDTTNPSSSAIVRAYTANPTTLGTLVGQLRSRKVVINDPAPGSGAVEPPYGILLHDESKGAQALVLRGANEGIAINLAGITHTGFNFSAYVEWTEDRI